MIKWYSQLVESKRALFNGMSLKVKTIAIRLMCSLKNHKRKNNRNKNMNLEMNKRNKQFKALSLKKKVEMKL
jgi:hypothetical protein